MFSDRPERQPLVQTVHLTECSMSEEHPDLRILTVNIHKGFAALNRRFVLEDLRHAIRAVNADLVFLQEVQGAHAARSARVEGWPQAPHYEYLADQLWPQFAYGRNAVYPHGHHGNALLSKYPIVRHENHDVSVGGLEARGLLHCELRMPGRELALHAICVHLGLRESHRRRQLALLCDIVAGRVPADAPLVVAGDFNDPLLELDRIYVRNARRHAPLPLPRRPWAALSDHAPIAAEVRL
jgi:endonuclease/exonuclease/phosphatase family metal-dependent hydrolase